jgi:hypothetical protein
MLELRRDLLPTGGGGADGLAHRSAAWALVALVDAVTS